MKVLIFGADGQDGFYLRKLCHKKSFETLPLSRNSVPLACNVMYLSEVEAVIKNYQPHIIFNFAANSSTRHEVLFENHETIATGTLNILESAWKYCRQAKVFIVGSGVQFLNTGMPISETDPFQASSPYAISRIQSVYAARYYRQLGLKTYVGYLFHHESPLRSSRHVSMKVAQAARRIAEGSTEFIEIGDATVEKEWAFAEDIVQGMMTLILQDDIHEAVIGSGQYHSIQEWIELCFSSLNLNWRKYVREQPEFSSEYQRLVSNPSTMRQLGWFPTVGITELARIMVSYDVAV